MWDQIGDNLSSTEQSGMLEKLLQDKLDEYCPKNTIKIGSQDKAWITAELKNIHRQRQREYIKSGKSLKYNNLAEEFETKYKGSILRKMLKV